MIFLASQRVFISAGKCNTTECHKKKIKNRRQFRFLFPRKSTLLPSRQVCPEPQPGKFFLTTNDFAPVDHILIDSNHQLILYFDGSPCVNTNVKTTAQKGFFFKLNNNAFK